MRHWASGVTAAAAGAPSDFAPGAGDHAAHESETAGGWGRLIALLLVYYLLHEHYLTERPLLVKTFGTTKDFALARALETASLAKINRLEAAEEPRIDAEGARRFDDFIQRFFVTLNRRGHKRTAFSWIAAPHHIWLDSAGHCYDLQEPLAEVRVVLERRLWDAERRRLKVLSSEVVRTIAVPD